MLAFIKVLYFIVCIVAVVYFYKIQKISPVTVFLAMQLLMFSGIITAPRASTDYGHKLIYMYFAALSFFILGVALKSWAPKHRTESGRASENSVYGGEPSEGISTEKRSRYIKRYSNHYAYANDVKNRSFDNEEYERNEKEAILNGRKLVVRIIIIVSFIACLYFFFAAGVNVFVDAIRNFASGSNADLSEDRRGYFNVFGVGYIYQFRCILLPLLTGYVVLTTDTKPIIKWTLSAFMLVFLLGTGQRNAFVYYLMIMIVYWILLGKDKRKISKVAVAAFAIVSVIALIILTIANGRVDASADNEIVGAIQSLIERVLGVNQRTALSAFRYIDSQPTVWGYDWAMMLRDILPGKSGYLSVDRIVYYLAYGTYSGTGPPCIWGSAWYNFSWIGVTVFPFILGIIYESVYQWFAKKTDVDSLMLLIYSSLSVLLGIWFCGSPMQLFNNGVVTVVLLYFVLFKIKIKAKDKGKGK